MTRRPLGIILYKVITTILTTKMTIIISILSIYVFSQWPSCKGYRNKHDKGPGPAAAILKLRNTFGEAAWEEMDKKKRNGTFGLNKCWFCGMDPCDHLGRNCPKRGVSFEGQANDHIWEIQNLILQSLNDVNQVSTVSVHCADWETVVRLLQARPRTLCWLREKA